MRTGNTTIGESTQKALSDGPSAAELFAALLEATKREAKEEAESDLWGDFAEKIASGDMRTAWRAMTDGLEGEGNALDAVLGLVQWLFNTGRLQATHGVAGVDVDLPAESFEQFDEQCISARLGPGHGTLYLQTPNYRQAKPPR